MSGGLFARLAAALPSLTRWVDEFASHWPSYSAIALFFLVAIVVMVQWVEKPIAIGPFTVVAGADAYGITAQALADQLRGHISLITTESGELFESRKLVDNALPLDIKLGDTGWTVASVLRAIGIHFTSAEVSGRISKTGEFLVMQFTTSYGDVIQEERVKIPLPKESAQSAVGNPPSEKPDLTFLSAIEGQVDCVALKIVVGVSRDVAANYFHKRDEAGGYDPSRGPLGKMDACIQGDDVDLYAQVREDRNAAPYTRVNALTGLSVHYSQTRQPFEELVQAQGARTLAAATMPCDDDHTLLTIGQRFQCLFHRDNKKNEVAQISSWMQLGAAYSDYAGVAATIAESSDRRVQSIRAYGHVNAIDPSYPLGYDALGLQLSFTGDFVGAIGEFDKSLQQRPTAPADIDYGIAKIRGRSAVYADKTIAPADLIQAEDHFKAAIDLEPAYWDAHSQLGYALYLHRKYSDAADVLQVAVAHDESNRYLRRLLASVLGNKCRFDDARAVFADAYHKEVSATSGSQDPSNVLADWGRALDGFGFHQAAMEQEAAVLDKEPKNVSALVFRGTMRIASAGSNQKQVDDAVGDLETAFRSDPSRSDFVLESNLLGLLKSGRASRAVQRYEEWASTGLVPPLIPKPPADASTLAPHQRLRVLYANALQASGREDDARIQRNVLSSAGLTAAPDDVDMQPTAGGTVADEDKQLPHTCNMGAWGPSPQLSDVEITDAKRSP